MSRGMATIVTTIVSVEFWKCKVSSRISIDGFTVDALLRARGWGGKAILSKKVRRVSDGTLNRGNSTQVGDFATGVEYSFVLWRTDN